MFWAERPHQTRLGGINWSSSTHQLALSGKDRGGLVEASASVAHRSLARCSSSSSTWLRRSRWLSIPRPKKGTPSAFPFERCAVSSLVLCVLSPVNSSCPSQDPPTDQSNLISNLLSYLSRSSWLTRQNILPSLPTTRPPTLWGLEVPLSLGPDTPRVKLKLHSDIGGSHEINPPFPTS